MKRPDCKDVCLAAALLSALGAAGCGGVNANVPISPMMFMQNSVPAEMLAEPSTPLLAVTAVPAEAR